MLELDPGRLGDVGETGPGRLGPEGWSAAEERGGKGDEGSHFPAVSFAEGAGVAGAS